MISLLKSFPSNFLKVVILRNKQVIRTITNLDEDGQLSHYKTSITFLNQESEGIFIESFSDTGITLTNGVRVIGPCAVFPRSILHWNVKNIEDVSPESLRLFSILDPKLDLLVMGVGDYDNIQKVNPEVLKYLREKKINMEILATDQALSVYNFLNAEKRYVAGVFIPPINIITNEDEGYLL